MKLLKFFRSVVSVGESKMVILVRTDIKMGQGKIASQCAHAAVSLCTKASKTDLNIWLISGQPKVILKVNKDCETTMMSLYNKARANDLNACLIYDAGKTQIQTGTLTAIGIGPNNKKDIDILTKNFKLL